MDWEQEIIKLVKYLNPQVILLVGVFSELIKRSVWKSLGWSKSYFWIVTLILSFPVMYLFSFQDKMSWQLFTKNSLLAGGLMILLYDRAISPILRKYLGNGEQAP